MGNVYKNYKRKYTHDDITSRWCGFNSCNIEALEKEYYKEIRQYISTVNDLQKIIQKTAHVKRISETKYVFFLSTQHTTVCFFIPI